LLAQALASADCFAEGVSNEQKSLLVSPSIGTPLDLSPQKRGNCETSSTTALKIGGPPRKRKQNDNGLEDKLGGYLENANNFLVKSSTNVDDPNEAFGKMVTYYLNKMPPIEAMKAQQEVMQILITHMTAQK
jgi:hypothetical protein